MLKILTVLLILLFVVSCRKEDESAPLIKIRYEIVSDTELPFLDAVFAQANKSGDIKEVRDYGMKGDGTFFKEVELPEGSEAKVVVRHKDSDDWYVQILSDEGELLKKGKPQHSNGIYYVALIVDVKK